MSILTDNLCNEPISDTGFVVAYIRMMQIMEDDVERFIVKHYVSQERPVIKGNGFDGIEIGEGREEAEAFIEFVNSSLQKQREEIERLNGLVAMQAEALKMASDFKLNDIVHGYINSALSASSDTVSAYKREVQNKERHDTLSEVVGLSHDYSDRQGNIFSSDFRSLLKSMASELRAKGE